ncbi:MAG: M20/M25/M40 family metallo-hydrolase, partial [Phycisphaerae bacterium]
TGRAADAICATVTFEKLHNAAFARRTDGPAMRAILAATAAVGAYHGEPVRGWDVSCDARIFAKEFPDAEIITFGPGLLARAHANDEQIDIHDVLIAAEVLARLALTYQP